MNRLARVGKMPWLATIRAPQNVLYVFVLFIPAIQVSKAVPLLHGAWAQVGAALLLAALAVLWKCISNTLWLARDARSLCLPGVECDADLALVPGFLVGVVLPAFFLGAAFGHAALWFVSLALVAAMSLALYILPMVLVLPVVAGLLLVLLFGDWHPPLPGDPDYLRWAVPTTLALTAAVLQRWFAIRHASTFDESSLLRPTAWGGRLVQLRKLRGEYAGPLGPGYGKRRRRRPSEHLNHVGPANPVRSIGTALDRQLMPAGAAVTPVRLRRARVLIGLLLLVLPLLALLAYRHYGPDAVAAFSPQLLLFVAIGMTATSISRHACAMRWSGRHAELPLLALLPRLDHAARIRRDTLVACLARTVTIKFWIAVSIAMAVAVLRLPGAFYAYLVLMFACGVLLEAAIAANVLGGRPLPRWVPAALYAATVMVPTLITMNIGLPEGHAAHVAFFGWRTLVCVALWLLWCAGFAVLALRGWRALQCRPHPFLANAS